MTLKDAIAADVLSRPDNSDRGWRWLVRDYSVRGWKRNVVIRFGVGKVAPSLYRSSSVKAEPWTAGTTGTRTAGTGIYRNSLNRSFASKMVSVAGKVCKFVSQIAIAGEMNNKIIVLKLSSAGYDFVTTNGNSKGKLNDGIWFFHKNGRKVLEKKLHNFSQTLKITFLNCIFCFYFDKHTFGDERSVLLIFCGNVVYPKWRHAKNIKLAVIVFSDVNNSFV